ncbi:hypothetical protein COK55_13795 [Bacillus cereus]|nr:hypothetical protein COK55_13795 [Bacillus cereus]
MTHESIRIEIPQPKERKKMRYKAKKPRARPKKPKTKRKMLQYWFEYGLEKVGPKDKPQINAQQQRKKVEAKAPIIEFNGGADLNNWDYEKNQKL